VEDLEEVVGEFGEDPGRRPELHIDGDERLHAMGTVRLERLGATLGLVPKHEEVDTVGGLVLAFLGGPPAAGDIVPHDGVGPQSRGGRGPRGGGGPRRVPGRLPR
jgi:CBS domain containing-hemolysin-like protein